MAKARLMTLEEAEEWCNLNSPTRTKPVYQEYIHNAWGKGKCIGLERIDPDDDFMSADIVGYGETNRLWTSRPTEEQRNGTPWN